MTRNRFEIVDENKPALHVCTMQIVGERSRAAPNNKPFNGTQERDTTCIRDNRNVNCMCRYGLCTVQLSNSTSVIK